MKQVLWYFIILLALFAILGILSHLLFTYFIVDDGFIAYGIEKLIATINTVIGMTTKAARYPWVLEVCL